MSRRRNPPSPLLSPLLLLINAKGGNAQIPTSEESNGLPDISYIKNVEKELKIVKIQQKILALEDHKSISQLYLNNRTVAFPKAFSLISI